jgi:hypothetical protein
LTNRRQIARNWFANANLLATGCKKLEYDSWQTVSKRWQVVAGEWLQKYTKCLNKGESG